MRRFLPVCITLLFLCKLTIAQEPTIEWQSVYNGSLADPANFFDIQKTSDNGYILFGCADNDGVFENARIQGGMSDPALMYKIDASGVVQWKNTFAPFEWCVV